MKEAKEKLKSTIFLPVLNPPKNYVDDLIDRNLFKLLEQRKSSTHIDNQDHVKVKTFHNTRKYEEDDRILKFWIIQLLLEIDLVLRPDGCRKVG